MPVALNDLENHVNELLITDQFSDYCPNGLQVQGRDEVQLLITGVTASLELIKAAVEKNADLIFVHHGYFWKGENPVITGIKRDRIQRLLNHDINLMAYHLPLDVHPELGNNAQLGKLLDLEVTGKFARYNNHLIGLHGRTDQLYEVDDFCELISNRLARKPLLIRGGDRKISTVAWCTGAAQGYIEQAAELGVDAFISGEISEPTVHIAREAGIHYFAAGHHATERYGVQAVGNYLADKFDLQHEFIDIENPA